MTSATEIRDRQHAKTEAVLASIDATLATITFGDFLVMALGESEAMALRDMVASAKALYDSEGCYFDRGEQ